MHELLDPAQQVLFCVEQLVGELRHVLQKPRVISLGELLEPSNDWAKWGKERVTGGLINVY